MRQTRKKLAVEFGKSGKASIFAPSNESNNSYASSSQPVYR
jgi:hypothetical protein